MYIVKFLGSSLAPYSSSTLGDLLRLLRITSQVLGVIYGCDVLNKFKLIRVALARVLLARLLGGSLYFMRNI